MKMRLKLLYLGCLFMMLCMLCPQQKIFAAATQKMNVTLDLSEFDDPDFPIEAFLANHIAEAIGTNNPEYIKIVSSQIIERKINVSYTAKFTYLPDIYILETLVTLPGYKKGDELKQQMVEAIKASNDRYEKVYDLKDAEAREITYDVSYQYTGPSLTKDTEPTPKPSKSKMDLNVPSAYLCKGETLQLKLNNPPKKIQKVTWKSHDSKVAKVSAQGKVTAVNYGSTWIDLEVYAGGKEYYFLTYITVYKLNGFQDGETKRILSRGQGDISLSDVLAWLDIKGAEDSLAPYAIPYNRVKVEIKSTGDNLAKIVEEKEVGQDGLTYLSGFNIETYRDGIVTIIVSDKKSTCKMELVIGTGVSRLDPVDAIKKNDFTGYEGDELKSMQTVRAFFDKFDMFSESMSQEEKISHIVDYFIATYKDESYIPYKHGTVYRTMIDGHGVCADYSETFCFLCDCLGIKNVEETGLAGGDAHAWNKVEVDGKWYHIDSYWCANLRNKGTYYLSSEIWLDHVKTNESDYYHDGDIPYIGDFR
ncbi:transglutaminase domain-containing protein [Anaerocolumna chitinilytica]|uniref:Transglutaminase-like domain-containing protein n=1 Tax=Anaerocolumna chitinilytica TaxID=1727145 RepID=A0A7M3S984_9FIRM|nr:transglutaminase domain-containing protein [Anaerocolumna chitinilytica]BCK01152.1 hypothetical protein bsdcttw_41920 [Anaerocolumna chitinilytica]